MKLEFMDRIETPAGTGYVMARTPDGRGILTAHGRGELNGEYLERCTGPCANLIWRYCEKHGVVFEQEGSCQACKEDKTNG